MLPILGGNPRPDQEIHDGIHRTSGHLGKLFIGRYPFIVSNDDVLDCRLSLLEKVDLESTVVESTVMRRIWILAYSEKSFESISKSIERLIWTEPAVELEENWEAHLVVGTRTLVRRFCQMNKDDSAYAANALATLRSIGLILRRKAAITLLELQGF